MNLTLKSIFAISALTLSASAIAQTQPEEFSEKLEKLTGISVLAVEDAPIEGFKQLVTASGIFYVTNDGEHIFSGALHKFENGFPSLTNQRLSVVKKAAIDEWADTFITYESPVEEHEIIVFYDSSCPFCVRMHTNVESYLQQGITIHYAAFPRGGVGSPSERDLRNIFCAEDKHAALDASIHNERLEPATCENESLIASHYNLGEQLNVRGTPAIYTFDNVYEVPGGAIPAPQLRGMLDAL